MWIKKVNRFGGLEINYYICIMGELYIKNKKKDKLPLIPSSFLSDARFGYEPSTIQRYGKEMTIPNKINYFFVGTVCPYVGNYFTFYYFQLFIYNELSL